MQTNEDVLVNKNNYRIMQLSSIIYLKLTNYLTFVQKRSPSKICNSRKEFTQ